MFANFDFRPKNGGFSVELLTAFLVTCPASGCPGVFW